MQSHKFLSGFIGSCLILVGLTGVIVYLINVNGYYGDRQLSSVIYNARYGKFKMLERRSQAPEAIILGSSNSMRMLPEKLKELTTLNSFNYGVFWATSEDFYCLAKVIKKDLRLQPKLLVFALDDWNFSEVPPKHDEVFEGANNRLSFKPEISKYLPDYSEVKLFGHRVATLFQKKQLLDGLNGVYRKYSSGELKFELAEDIILEAFDTNGVGKEFGNLEREIVTEKAESGNYDPSGHLIRLDQEYSQGRNAPRGLIDIIPGQNFSRLSDRRKLLFEETIQEFKSSDIVISIMPCQPYFLSLLEERTNYNKRLQDLLKWLLALKAKYPNIKVVQDNHTIENFGGYPNHFFDHFHPTSVNSSLILERLIKEYNNAVQ